MPCVLRGVATVKGVSIEAINEASKSKPDGYLEEVMSYVVERKDNFVLFENDDYYMLRDKYSGDVDPVHRGPGTELHKLLAFFGVHMRAGCSCRGRMVQMNKWGCDGCEEHLEEIVGWLREEAAARKLPYLDVAGKMLVRLAISNARREAKRAKPTA
jgi:hypothetical protein